MPATDNIVADQAIEDIIECLGLITVERIDKAIADLDEQIRPLNSRRAKLLAIRMAVSGDPVESSAGSIEKPQKPYPNFPLFAHGNGLWAKKIMGRTRYYGYWARRINGVMTPVDLEQSANDAVAEFKRCWPYHSVGREAPEAFDRPIKDFLSDVDDHEEETEQDSDEQPYRSRADEITDFVADNPGMFASGIATGMIDQGLTDSSRAGLQSAISKMVRDGKLKRDQDWKIWPVSLESEDQASRAPKAAGCAATDSIAAIVREWLLENPESTLAEIKRGVIHKIRARSRRPGDAIRSSLRQMEIAKRVAMSEAGTYRLLIPPGKLNVDLRVSTKSVVLDYLRKNPGYKNYEIGEALADQVDTTIDPVRAVLASLSNMQTYGVVVKRSDDTYWLPEQADLMASTQLRHSNAEERQNQKKWDGVLTVLKAGENEQCQAS